MVLESGASDARWDRQQSGMFSYVSPEDRVPKDHPLRKVRALVEPILKKMSARFDAIYSRGGRPSIPPEMLVRALLLQVLYSIRSERQLMEQMDYNLLNHWFVGMNLDDPIWDPTTFSKNRDRLLANVAQAFLQGVFKAAEERSLLLHDHFTVDGTFLEASASHKSLVPRDAADRSATDDDDPGNPSVDFRGEKRSNRTHVSRTDPDARLACKSWGTASRMRYLGNVLVDNRHSLIVGTLVNHPGYHTEGDAALEMLTALGPSPDAERSGATRAMTAAPSSRTCATWLHCSRSSERARQALQEFRRWKDNPAPGLLR